jgi:hypothetical protein
LVISTPIFYKYNLTKIRNIFDILRLKKARHILLLSINQLEYIT